MGCGKSQERRYLDLSHVTQYSAMFAPTWRSKAIIQAGLDFQVGIWCGRGCAWPIKTGPLFRNKLYRG